MYRIQSRRAIINRKSLVSDLQDLCGARERSPHRRAETLHIVKRALSHGTGEIRRRLESRESDGPGSVRAQAYLIDQIIRSIYDVATSHVFPQPKNAQTLSLVATGGYGRSELAPCSDVDLLFLVPGKCSEDNERIIEYLLYMLWDAGLKVGHATRTIDDNVRLAKKDLSICTSLLEARWLWGDEALFKQFTTRFYADVVSGTGRQYVERKLAERDDRHERMGDSRYVLEPHIKEGKGGLRDLQTVFWIAKYLYQVEDVRELADRGVFTQDDLRQFRKARSFLLSVRCHLHYVAGRPEERLTFDVQKIIGRRLGYNERTGARSVERFMKHYFRTTKSVGDLTRVLCAVLEEEQKKTRFRLRLPTLSLFSRIPADFKLDGDRLTVESEQTFISKPVNLLRLFREAQRTGRDIHPKALRLAQQHFRLVNAALRQDPEANRLFVEMLSAEVDPEPMLRRLNEVGLFGRFIPDFGRVVAQMQYDMYHHFTVDEHAIRAIGILGRIERGELKTQHPTATAVFGEIRSRRALYLAVLLHDIAKGRGGDHSELGAEVALKLSPRLGLDDWETETVSWLVLHHLLMSRVAFKRDLDNPKTIFDFIDIVQSPERLRMLHILTNADISAVAPGTWNAWKEGLLGELYFRALEEMEMTGGQPRKRREIRVEQAKNKIRERLSGWHPETLETCISRGYPDYWLAFHTDEQVRHFHFMRRADGDHKAFDVEAIPLPDRDSLRVTVYAPDHIGLFAQIAGAIAISGATIVDARITTMANSMALDVLHIETSNGHHLTEADRRNRLVKRIKDSLCGQWHADRELNLVHQHATPSRTQVFKVPARVIFDNKASIAHTVIELNGRDRKGLLFDVASTLTTLGLQIASAHISTYGERVVDVFYVKDQFGLKIDQTQKLERIEGQLLRAIEGPDYTPQQVIGSAAAS